MLISTSSKKTKRKEGGENQYSLTRLQQWKGGDKGEQRKQIINVLTGPLSFWAERELCHPEDL